jgi:hypothetical protein
MMIKILGQCLDTENQSTRHISLISCGIKEENQEREDEPHRTNIISEYLNTSPIVIIGDNNCDVDISAIVMQ